MIQTSNLNGIISITTTSIVALLGAIQIIQIQPVHTRVPVLVLRLELATEITKNLILLMNIAVNLSLTMMIQLNMLLQLLRLTLSSLINPPIALLQLQPLMHLVQSLHLVQTQHLVLRVNPSLLHAISYLILDHPFILQMTNASLLI